MNRISSRFRKLAALAPAVLALSCNAVLPEEYALNIPLGAHETQIPRKDPEKARRAYEAALAALAPDVARFEREQRAHAGALAAEAGTGIFR